MPAGDYSKASIGSVAFVQIGSDYLEIDGLSNLDMNSPDNTTANYQLLNGRSIQRSGPASPYTLTGERAANMGTRVFNTLFNAKHGTNALTIRFDSAPAEPVFTPPSTGSPEAAIASATGIVSFSGATTEIEAALASRKIAPGYVIVIDNKLYAIDAITDADVVTAVDVTTWAYPAADVAADSYVIVNPKWRYEGLAHVNQIGNLSVSTDGNPATDSLSIGFIQSGIPWQVLQS